MMHWFWFGNPYWGYPAFFGGFGIIFMILVWVFFIALIILLVRGTLFGLRRHRHTCYYHDDEALQILKRLYAEGKITEEEFEKKKRELLD
ncbi:SHOCT domain-containing protein [Caldisericum sp. AR60]|uniref:SHOCT domain-containing protein n=1 Tax=Caldisericum sp. AR60 TaxID=3397852 RepID=UPI0039FD3095